MMKMIKYSSLFLILVFSLSGCFCNNCPEPELKTEYKYIKRPIPKLPTKPQFIEYQMFVVEFDNKEYYALPKGDGYILKNNWEAYKNWAENLRDILIDLKKDKQIKPVESKKEK